MTVDCYALSVLVKGGSSLCIPECGGIQVTSGDLLLVKAPLAGALYVQYKRYLSEPLAVQLQDQERLRHGHYEHRRMKMVVKTAPEKEQEVVEVSEPKQLEDIADNRSMASEKGKKKTRRKRTPTKAKRKEEQLDG